MGQGHQGRRNQDASITGASRGRDDESDPSMVGACAAAHRGAGPCAELSRQTGAFHRWLHRRQCDRHHREAVRGEIRRGLERAGDGRECAGSRRQRRRRPRGEIGAGRYDVLLGRQWRAHHQPDAAAEPDLRRGARSCAGRAAADRAEHCRGEQRRAGQDFRRADRARQGAAWQAVLRLARRRYAAAYRRRAAQEFRRASTSRTCLIAARCSPT